MGGRHSRNKGAAWERRVANDLKPFFPNARRGLGQARSAGEVCDVEGTPWWVECKRMRKCSPTAAWHQAKAVTDGRPVLVVWKDDRMPAEVLLERPGQSTVVMTWTNLLETLRLGWRPKTSTSAPSTETPASKPD